MLSDDLDRIRIEVESKLRLLLQKRKELSQLDGQLGKKATDPDSNRISIKKTRQLLLYEIRLLEEALTCAVEEHAKGRHRLERVIAIKHSGSLPRPLDLDRAVLSTLTNRVASNAGPPLDQTAEESRRSKIIRKVENPATYPVVLIAEAATYFEVNRRTIYRWKAEGKLRSGARRGTIATESMQRWKKKRSRKRPLR
jgi:hypothetical protein